MKKKIAVFLAGSGNQDGSEITEATSLIISLAEFQAEVDFFAPNSNFTPLDFITHKPMGNETRNLMLEAARITRGKINSLEDFTDSGFDALILPGGMGAALYLSNWASLEQNCQVHPKLESALLNFHKSSRPIGAICIAPAIVARVLGKHDLTVTCGDDLKTAQAVQKTGARVERCPAYDFISDRLNKVVSAPAYMCENTNAFEVYTGIRNLTKEIIEMA